MKLGARFTALLTVFLFVPMISWGAKVKSTETKVSDAIFWYSQVKKIDKEKVSPQVTGFLQSFFTFLDREASESAETVAPRATSERELEYLLQQYDALIRVSGTDGASRQFELKALSFAVQDTTTDVDDFQRLRFLERFHLVIDAHYAAIATSEIAAAEAATPTTVSSAPPVKIKTSEVLKAIGSYSIYGFCLNSAFYVMTGEYKLHSFFSEPVFLRMAIVAVASGPFSFFNQLFLQTFEQLNTSIKVWRSDSTRRRNSALPKTCEQILGAR